MNFFQHQERARRRTWLLASYFVLAILAIVSAVSLCLYLAAMWMRGGHYPLSEWLQSPAMLWSVIITLLIVLVGSARKAWQLRGGGVALAELLGAREVLPDATTQEDRQLRNVTEEMSIASGIPAPRTFVMEHEQAINALVAGYRPTEAVLIVTRGTLDALSREELQGVIAHEFSHIFNADMRLNMRLIAVLAGILAIGKVGELLLHANTRARFFNHRSGRNEAAGIAFLIILGLAMMIIGYIGLFFGRLIKAAISRQRELLADASSVQFTRNPSGIANALIKIRNQHGSHLLSSHGEDMSHMCFGATVPFHLQHLLATHPPLDNRLKALGGDWLARARVRQKQNGGTPHSSTMAAPEQAMGFAGNSPAQLATSVAALGISGSIGTVAQTHMGYAQSLYQSIPEEIKQNLRQPESARWVVLALAIGASRSSPEQLTASLSLTALEKQIVQQLADQISALGTRLRLPLTDLAIPALKQLPDAQRDAFLQELENLVREDKRLTLFEFVLTRILADHLRTNAGRSAAIRFRQYSSVAAQIQLVLSLMVHASGAKDEQARQLFSSASGTLLPAGRTLLGKDKCRIELLDQALTDLRDLTPLLKGPLLDGLADVARADGMIQVQEAELLRGIATLMDCPMPPLLQGSSKVA
ncbi:MAG: M48 family metalloprotease [Alcanivoracaceae bacterium]|nr:M48 family metalloprotease [Alcanivoracaceae bacterium]